MRILIIPSWFPSDGSRIVGSFVLDQAIALSSAVDVAALVPDVHSPRPGRGSLRASTRLVEHMSGVAVFRQTSINILPRTRMGKSHGGRRAARLGYEWITHAWAVPDVIHAHTVYPAGHLAVALGRQHDVPVVLTEHSGPFAMHLEHRWKREIVESVLKNVNLTLAVSPSLKKEIIDFYGEARIEVVGNVICDRFFDLAESRPDLGGELFTFACVAGLEARKGVDVLVRAAADLKRRLTHPFRVVILGDGPERRRLEGLSRDLGTEDVIAFVGARNREVVRDTFHRSHSFVLPSLAESFSVATAEAMSCGLPVVATKCGGPEWFVGPDTGILVDVGSPEALADGMAEVVTTYGRFDRKRIRQSVTDRFGEDALRAQLLHVYSRVTG